MLAYVSLSVLVIIIIWQGYVIKRYDSKFDKIQKYIYETIQNEDSKPREELLTEFLVSVCNALYN